MTDSATPLRTLIADDEPLAIERMQILCSNQPRLALVGTASDGEAAIRMAGVLDPDLIFLDIAMPGEDGMSVARQIAEDCAAKGKRPPGIVFVTAFEAFAVEAFDLSATDSLLKPVSEERLARAIDRVAQHRAQPPAPGGRAASGYAEEFWVPSRSSLVRIAARDIDRIDAERDYMRLSVGDRSYLIHQTITALEARLDPSIFIRLHRSVIVRRDRIAGLGHDRAGAWQAELVDGEVVRIGRTHLQAAKAMIGRATA
jgi:two-component system response regulator AlgR